MNKKKIIKCTLIFILFFLSLVFIFTVNRGDTYVNYGFSYAISKGEIPYKDFNMVISPLAPFLYSIGLLINKNIIVFYLEQALLLTFFYSIIKELLKEKTALFMFFFLMPFPIAMTSTLFPGYNFLILLLFILFIYCFKNKNNDYLLGLILGLIFITKQTIGIMLFIPTLYYLFTNRKKFFRMLIGYLIPCCILLIYLLLTNSLYEFIDLCFLGLFDFQSNNNYRDYYYLLLALLGIGFIIFKIVKDKNNILLYYMLMFSSVILPIIDYYHVSLFLVIVFYLLTDSITYKPRYNKVFITLIGLNYIIWSIVTISYFKDIKIVNQHNFLFNIVSNNYYKNVEKTKNYLKTLDEEKIYFLRGSENYYFKIMNDEKINYFDLPNYGNYGLNGIEKMKKEIDKKNNVYFVLDKTLFDNKNKGQQYITELAQYIIDNSKKINNIAQYDIYYKIN